MDVLIIILALCALMFVAYRGLSVILLAPVCALMAVAFTLGPAEVLPYFSDVFMTRMVAFVRLYFPVLLLGAVFGKVVEVSGAAKAISGTIIKVLGAKRSMLSIVTACAVLTYGGVSVFVVAFAVYPFAASLFKDSNIPKRLIPGTIALGAFTFAMDALPGTPQIQNVIPTTFFGTNIYAAPWLGIAGAIFVLAGGMSYLEWQRRKAEAAEEGYGEGHTMEPEPQDPNAAVLHPAVAILPLLAVGVVNALLSRYLKVFYGETHAVLDQTVKVSKMAGIWSIELALLSGIALGILIGGPGIFEKLNKALQAAVSGALLATMNTASEYGFGGVIASLPGFTMVKEWIGGAFSNPLVSEAVSVNVLAGITGSASGGLSLALAALGDQYLTAAKVAGIPPEVLHRIASMAAGGMDTLPHNGAVITLLVITGLTHRQSYKDIFFITCLKTVAVFCAIAVYQFTGIY